MTRQGPIQPPTSVCGGTLPRSPRGKRYPHWHRRRNPDATSPCAGVLGIYYRGFLLAARPFKARPSALLKGLRVAVAWGAIYSPACPTAVHTGPALWLVHCALCYSEERAEKPPSRGQKAYGSLPGSSTAPSAIQRDARRAPPGPKPPHRPPGPKPPRSPPVFGSRD